MSESQLLKLPIHTSDRISFKRCRQNWDFGSILRQRWRPKETPRPLSFGTAVHKALEVYYDPSTWHIARQPDDLIIKSGAIQAFVDSMRESKKRYLDLTGKTFLEPDQQADYDLHMDLGLKMLEHYFVWCKKRDHNWEVVAVELDFEVSLGFVVYPEVNGDTSEPMEVVYRGRLDVLIKDEFGRYWIVDHKTAARFEEDIAWLDMDEQVGSYCWALRELGYPVEGVIYNQLRKAYPEPLAELSVVRKGCRFSTNKMKANTTYEAAVVQLIEAGENLALYEDFLNWLRANPPSFNRRIQVHRSKANLDILGEQIKIEAWEMTNPSVNIYPTPSKFSCQWCSFRVPCMSKYDGQDPNFILSQNYQQIKNYYNEEPKETLDVGPTFGLDEADEVGTDQFTLEP